MLPIGVLRTTLGLLLVLPAFQCGCAMPRRWNVISCDEGQPPKPSETAIVLVHTRALSVFRVRLIDDLKVDDGVEYHLMPGEHVIVTGVSKGESMEVPLRCMLHAGFVYRLMADVWNLSDRWHNIPVAGPFQRIEFDWRPRLVELGRFDELTDGRLVDSRIIEHIRPRPLSLMIRVRHDTVGIDKAAEPHAHFTGTGHLASMLLTVLVEIPPEHWGVLPRNILYAREDSVRGGSKQIEDSPERHEAD